MNPRILLYLLTAAPPFFRGTRNCCAKKNAQRTFTASETPWDVAVGTFPIARPRTIKVVNEDRENRREYSTDVIGSLGGFSYKIVEENVRCRTRNQEMIVTLCGETPKTISLAHWPDAAHVESFP